MKKNGIRKSSLLKYHNIYDLLIFDKYYYKNIININELEKTLSNSSNESLNDNINNIIEGIILTKISNYNNNSLSINYLFNIIKIVKKTNNIHKKHTYNIIKNILFNTPNNNLCIELINNINNYLKFDKYIIYFFNSLSRNDLYQCLYYIIKNKNITNIYNIFNILIKSKHIQKNLLKTNLTGLKYENEINIISTIYNIDLINEFNVNNNENYNIIVDNYFNNKLIFKFINYLNDILDKNKLFNSINTNTETFSNQSSLIFLLFVYKISLLLFNKIDKNNIFKNINDKNNENTKRINFNFDDNDNLETKIYLLALKSFNLIQFEIINLKKINLDSNNQIYNQRYNMAKKIILDPNFELLINNLTTYYITNFLQINNDIQYSIINYYYNTKNKDNDNEYYSEPLQYCYKLMELPVKYCNYNIKYDVLKFICSVLLVRHFNKEVDIDIYDYILYKKDTDNLIHTSNIINNFELFKALLYYHTENNIFNSYINLEYHKYYQYSIFMFNLIFSLSNLNNDITTFIKNNTELILKFYYKLYSYITSNLENINIICNNSNDIDTYNKFSNYKFILMNIINSVLYSLDLMNIILTNNILDSINLRREIVNFNITLIISILNYFTKGNTAFYEIFYFNMEGLYIMKYAIFLLHKLSNNSHFNDLINDFKNIIIETLKTIKFEEEHLIIKEELINKLKNINIIDLTDIPNDFLDPILCSIINDPVMIPNVDLIFDKSSILGHLYNEKNNPYTREYLDENILNNFNNEKNIKEKIIEYQNNFNMWKNKNK